MISLERFIALMLEGAQAAVNQADATHVDLVTARCVSEGLKVTVPLAGGDVTVPWTALMPFTALQLEELRLETEGRLFIHEGAIRLLMVPAQGRLRDEDGSPIRVKMVIKQAEAMEAFAQVRDAGNLEVRTNIERVRDLARTPAEVAEDA